jgi:ABC-type branched-subunit amino acid transport system substrate-binding protein
MIFASPSPAGRDIPHDIGLTAGLPLDELGPRAVLAYDATQVLLKAIEATIQEEGEPSRQGVIAALPSVRVEGLTGDIATNPSGNRADAPVWLYRIVNNEYPGRRGKLIGRGPG